MQELALGLRLTMGVRRVFVNEDKVPGWAVGSVRDNRNSSTAGFCELSQSYVRFQLTSISID